MNIEKIRLQDHVDYSSDSIVSKKILENNAGGITLFAFDQNQRLSEHTSPYNAIVQVIEGVAEIIIDNKTHILSAGELIIMPANIPHAVNAHQQFKMLLTLIKGENVK
ncbi:MAG: cupin domain-containing protein [Oligoflexia bacterium]|nr:cupin domain-containing protein [Oligoflexia bacterium]